MVASALARALARSSGRTRSARASSSRLEAVWMRVDRCACKLDRGVDFAFGQMQAGQREPRLERTWIEVIASASARGPGEIAARNQDAAKDEVRRCRACGSAGGGLRRVQRFIELPVAKSRRARIVCVSASPASLHQVRQDLVRFGLAPGGVCDDGDAPAGAGKLLRVGRQLVENATASLSRPCCA